MNITDVLKKERVDVNLQVKTKQQALEKLTDLLFESGALTDKQAFLDDVLAREAASATGIGNGIAIPHGKSAYVCETTVAIGRVTPAIEWESVDDAPIQLIVLLAVSENDKTEHVRLLSQMARKLAGAENCKALLRAESAEKIIEIFSN